MRSVLRRVAEIGRAARSRARMPKKSKDNLPQTARHSRRTGKAIRSEIERDARRAAKVGKQSGLEALKRDMNTMSAGTMQLVARAECVFGGDTHAERKIVTVVEPSTEVIRKGNASTPTEFGKMISVEEPENHIVIDFEVYERKLNGSDLLIASIEAHQQDAGNGGG
jgi:IS5 family transposase